MHIAHLAVASQEASSRTNWDLRHLSQRRTAGSLLGSQFLILLRDAAIPGVTYDGM